MKLLPIENLSADLIWDGARLRTGLGLSLSQGGTILSFAPLEQLAPLPTRHLRGRALFPAFVNTHSHAFQRLIRGRTMTRPAHDARADFWSWRTAMYDAALRLEPEDVLTVTAYAYLEMLCAGIGSVAEFHYLHHDRQGKPYADPNLLAKAVLEAATEVGIRLCLLPVAYHRNSFDRPAQPEQRRFLSPSVAAYLEQLQQLEASVLQTRTSMFSLGVAAHSVRAVPETWLGLLAQHAARARLPFHIHISEQLAEVQQCIDATGLRPVELLKASGGLDAPMLESASTASCSDGSHRAGSHLSASGGLEDPAPTVLVHATHLSSREKAQIARAGARVSVCPTTERDLGDGLIDARGLQTRGVPLCLGSDSQVQVDFFAEMRCLEGHERLRRRQRNVLVDNGAGAVDTAEAQQLAVPLEVSDRPLSVVPSLWRAATREGAAALKLPVGSFRPGSELDGFTVDLEHAAFDGADVATLPGLLIAAGHPSQIAEVLVGGRVRVDHGRHAEADRIRTRYRALCRRIWG